MMDAALSRTSPGQVVTALAITNYENQRDIPGCTVLAAGHPIPDENGLRAGKMVISTLVSAGVEDHILCLISGGGSALLPAPLPGLTLAEKVRVNELMLSHGLDITAINTVRQKLSLLKGGGFSRFSAPAPVRTLAVSDVIGDDPRVIASGPTASPLGSSNDAVKILKEYGVWHKLPLPVKEALSGATPEFIDQRSGSEIEIVCSNRQSLEAIEQAAPDWTPQIVTARLSGNVDMAARKIADFVKLALPGPRRLLIWGGETTVDVRGSGKGGRNQELALRFAVEGSTISGDWVFLSGGTDGRDGPTDAAGGVVDHKTSSRLFDSGHNPQTFLYNNDSNRALELVDDLLVTGPTGTNVADIAVFLRR